MSVASMRMSKLFAGVFVFLVQGFIIVNSHGGHEMSVKDMFEKNLCICPCGNPQGGKLFFIPNQDKHNWFESVAKCSAYGMSIASIENDGQREQLRLFLNTVYGRNMDYWIGANTLAPGRGLRWGLSERDVRNPEWSYNMEPRFGPSEPFCVAMSWRDMKWVGLDCEKDERLVICEY